MDTMTKPLRTACHYCRGQAQARKDDADGVPRLGLVPVVPIGGDGVQVDLRATAGGHSAAEARPCPHCVDGWIPGFQPPC